MTSKNFFSFFFFWSIFLLLLCPALRGRSNSLQVPRFPGFRLSPPLLTQPAYGGPFQSGLGCLWSRVKKKFVFLRQKHCHNCRFLAICEAASHFSFLAFGSAPALLRISIHYSAPRFEAYIRAVQPLISFSFTLAPFLIKRDSYFIIQIPK